MTEHPIVSIIIPCYNSQNTLGETLQSVLNQDFKDWEAIMVNDGSPDNLEEIALKWVKKDSRFHYFKKENGGLGSARNYGISKAKGTYILPLDSDNKVRPNFLEKGIKMMNENPKVGVVYGNAMFFGEKDDLWRVGKFDTFKMLNHNYIDACALLRKSLCDTIGGYHETMPYQGHEDWDFWLKVVKSNYQFYYLEEITFDYRVTSSSMIKQFDEKMIEENEEFIKNTHKDLYLKIYPEIYAQYKKLNKKVIFYEKIRQLPRYRKLILWFKNKI